MTVCESTLHLPLCSIKLSITSRAANFPDTSYAYACVIMWSERKRETHTHSYTCTHTHLDLWPGPTCTGTIPQPWFPLFYTAQRPRKNRGKKSHHVSVSKAAVFHLLWTICFHDAKQAFREAADAPSDHSHRSWKRRGRWKRWCVGGRLLVLGSGDMGWNMFEGLTQADWVSHTTVH